MESPSRSIREDIGVDIGVAVSHRKFAIRLVHFTSLYRVSLSSRWVM